MAHDRAGEAGEVTDSQWGAWGRYGATCREVMVAGVAHTP